MSFDLVGYLFQMIAFLFAISVHESAHAWTANRCGDPTARMLGRITLNPIKHIDLIGTILLPAIAAYKGWNLLGWAKPTPVDPRNFRHPVRDDILTSVAGPVSNFVVATVALLLLWIIALTSATGRSLVRGASGTDSIMEPVVHLILISMTINIVLAIFNLIPVPPLDGSHVIRHFMSEPVRRVYDSIGIFGLFVLVFFGGGLLSRLIQPVIDIYLWALAKF